MGRSWLSLLTFLLLSAFLLGCGGGSKTVVTPQPQVTDAFMFLQEVPNQGTSFTPMTGEYSVLGNDVTFQAIPAQDPSSGQITAADFGSAYLSPSSNKITLTCGAAWATRWSISGTFT